MKDGSYPPSWGKTNLKEIAAHFESGKRPKGGVASYKDGVISLGGEHLRPDGTISTDNPKFVPHEFAKSLQRVRVMVDDILIVKDGATTGKTSLATGRHEGAVINEHLFQLRPSDALDARYLYYFLWSHSGNSEIMKDFRGSAQGGITKSVLDVCEVPVAPLNEQRRIVEKIETLFARLDKGEEALRDVQKLLARYRQSVLKAAVTGQLTADWRAENAHRLEPGQDLLARILRTRRETWDGRGKYKEPVAPDTTDLPGLPEGWVWASVDEASFNHDGRRVPIKRADRDERSGPYPYYGAQGVIDDIDDFLFDGSYLLVAEDGANLLSRSKPLAFQAHGRFWVNNHAHILQPLKAISLDFLELAINSLEISKSVTGTAQPKLTQAALNRLPVPLPCEAEQGIICDLVKEAYSRTEAVETLCSTELARSAALRQSILKDAFAGRLVPQDPTDEPAAALLARIRESRAAAPGKTRRKARA